MQEAQTVTGKFNLSITQLVGWVIKKKDGTIVRHTLDENSFREAKGEPKQIGYTSSVAKFPSVYPYNSGGSLSSYCQHKPDLGKNDIFSDGNIELYVASSEGGRASTNPDQFDLVIDCGDVLAPPTIYTAPILRASREGFEDLDQFEIHPTPSKYVDYLKIKWDDRQDPKLKPEFWKELAPRLKGKVVTTCVGGHGRSGSAAVCIMMALTPSYSALDAITHLRAVHCPRAIESTIQHDYINKVATVLGREANAHEAEKVKSYRAKFLEMALPKHLKKYQARLKKGGE